MNSIGSTDLPATPHELLKLESQLCFALYAASRTLIAVYRDVLDPLGITYPQYLVLIVLFEEQGLTVTQIGSKLMLDSGTLTPLLKRLEAMKIVERHRGVDDERTIEIRLTEKGLKLRGPLRRVSEHVDCRLGMSEGEVSDISALIMSVVAKIAEVDQTRLHANG